MADLADVETALLAALSGALFNLPLSTDGGLLLTTDSGQQILTDDGAGYVPPAVATTIGGVQTRLFRGWPASTGLIADMRAGVSQVSLFAAAGMTRNTTRYIELTWSPPVSSIPPTLILASNFPGVVTVNGTPAAGQLCGIRVGDPPATTAYAYAVLGTDTVATIATALALLIPGATPNGAVITMPTVAPLLTRCVQSVPSASEVRRQTQVFRLSCWAPSHPLRDALGAACDLALAPLSRITMLSGETLYQRYHGTRVDDVPTRNEVWLRELTYSVEYPTNVFSNLPEMLFGISNLNSVSTAE